MAVKYPRRNLYFAVFVVYLLIISCGCTMTWSSPAILRLEKWPGLTAGQEAWLGSIVCAGAVAGPLLYGIGLNRIGRRGTLIANGIVFVSSFLALALGRSLFSVLCVGRFSAGFGVGAALAIVPAYLTEIADDDSRQTINSLVEFFFGIGFFITFSVGPFVPYGWIAGADAVPAVLFLLIVSLIPESPYYYVAEGRVKDARKSLVWLRRTGNVDRELARIQREVRESKMNLGKLTDLFTHSGQRKAFILGNFVMFIQQLCAIDVVTNFAEPILKTSGISISPLACTLVVAAMNIVSGTVSTPFVAKFGSKPVLLFSAFVNAFGLLSFGTYKCLIQQGKVPNSTVVRLIPLISLLTTTGGYAFGFGSIPGAIIAELFPPPLKAFAVLTISSIAWLVDFLVLQGYGQLVNVVGDGPIFIFLGSGVFLCTIAMIFCVPNTKGMPLEKINIIFHKKSESEKQVPEIVEPKY